MDNQVSAEIKFHISQLADGTRSMREIAEAVGCSAWFVRDHIRRNKASGLRLSGNRTIVKQAAKPVSKKTAAKFAIANQGRGVSLMELTSHTCRWPLGKISDPVEKFCGFEPKAKSSYCEHHANLAYEQIKFRVRRPMWA